ncbi:hypothetical protein CMO83_04230 [Candidatus Woesearchaeota archaeon]|jgi:hypothetical protein|nr:hypothetical protein [Candidatus Woesearchaeota archaeon]MDP6648323.1 hypothetical protein [Candidatus Woesearchaeota archaeon]|tara:strand:- start:5183 stop:5749 length:567 start_codon:yes stop_codon:yes gene_type:complete
MKKVYFVILVFLVIFLIGCSKSDGKDTAIDEPIQVQDTRTVPQNLEYKIVYNLLYVTESERLLTEGNVIYVKGRNTRLDLNLGEAVTRSYNVNGKYHTCFTEGGSWVCFEGPEPVTTDSNDPPDIDFSPDALAVLEKDGTKRVAGTTAQCYKFSSADVNNVYSVCEGFESCLFCPQDCGSVLFLENLF